MLGKIFSSWLSWICRPMSQILCAFTILCCALCIGLLFFGCDDDEVTPPPDELSPEKELLTLYHPVGYLTSEDRSASILTEENHAGWKKADCTKCHRSPSEDAPEVCANCHGKNGVGNQENTCSNCHKVQSKYGDPASGNHQAHVVKGPKDTNCVTCHPGGPDASTVHANGIADILLGGEGKYATVTDDKGTTSSCSNIECHEDVREWGGDCSSCHSSPPDTGTHKKHLEQKNLSCQSCHSGNQHDSDNESGVIELGGIKYDPITGDCTSTCHGKPQSWTCLGCHAYPPDTGSHIADGHEVSCVECHENHTHSYKSAVLPLDFSETEVNFAQDGKYSNNTRTCSGIACHGDEREWGVSCDGCHAAPPDTGTHIEHVQQEDIKCQECHLDNQHDLDNSSGSIELGGIEYNPITGNCTSTCHEEKKWECIACHDEPPDSGNHLAHDNDCGQCHQEHIHSYKAAIQPTDLTEVSVEIADGGEYSSNSETCSGFPCHEPRIWGENCAQCHDSPPETGRHLLHVQGNGLSCQNCHERNHHDSDSESGFIELGGIEYDPITGNCTSECHKQDKWNCTDCHGYPSDTGSHLAHEDSCDECHHEHEHSYNSAMAPRDFRLTQINFAAGGNYDPQSRNCSNTSCHPGSIVWGFTHTGSDFPLIGKHQNIDCAECHIGGQFDIDAQCVSCHQDDDPHSGQLGNECEPCHTPSGWRPPAFTHDQPFPDISVFACAVCHDEDDPHQDQFGSDCRSCHVPTAWKPSTFDHTQSDFKLTGKHQNLDCAKCHVDGQFDIDTQCAACHQDDDPHGGQLGNECESCHTPLGWDLHTFDHDQTSFPLAGKHQNVDCAQCHTDEIFDIDIRCISCHQNDGPHNGQLGDICESCHTPSGWQPSTYTHDQVSPDISNIACTVCHADDDPHEEQFDSDCRSCHVPGVWKPSIFDHTQSAFQLTGKHQDVDCSNCHVSGRFDIDTQCISCHQDDDSHSGQLGNSCELCHTPSEWGLPTFAHGQTSPDISSFACAVCHDDDNPHDGQFTDDCRSCHVSEAWKPSIFDHTQAAFQLIGEHQSVDCSNCHIDGQFHIDSQCASCHQDDDSHNGQLGDTCELCHTPSGWDQTMVRHEDSDFPLTGGHENTSCTECHTGGQLNIDTQCISCHQDDDSHSGQLGDSCESCHTPSGWESSTFAHGQASPDISSFACAVCHEGDAPHEGQFDSDCRICHIPGAWKPSIFNHAQAEFPLTGEHGNLDCAKCHVNGQYDLDTQCVSCHRNDEPHNGQLGNSCELCHAATGWEPSTYTHDQAVPDISNVACAVCHQDDDPHDGQFHTDCRSCHVPGAWEPSIFDHNQSDFPLTGEHQNFDCANCHVNGQYAIDTECISCHQNDDPHNGQLGNSCEVCHTPSGWIPPIFDHDQSNLPLTGEHESLDCTRCHIDGEYDLDTQCDSCHQDDEPHQGRLGSSCELCHDTTGWELSTFTHSQTLPDISGIACIVCHSDNDSHSGQLGSSCEDCHVPADWIPSIFDHDQSDFPITGEHENLDCTRCHINGQYDLGTQCDSCHQDDEPHSGKLGDSCELCHDTTGWEPSTFTHSRTVPDISGIGCIVCHSNDNPHSGQLGSSCELCHDTAGWQPSTYTHDQTAPDISDVSCIVCHSNDDPHSGQFGNSCEVCHTPSGWIPSIFDHNQSDFPLTGGHQNLDCAICHFDGQYDLDTQCASCHQDDEPHSGKLGDSCELCHDTTGWELSTFTHSQTLPDISGIACIVCHSDNDSHSGQLGSSCEDCHIPAGWIPSIFDHDQSDFPLTGAHETLNCAMCHIDGQYDLDTQCASCHQDDEPHNGQLGNSCELCHNTNGWEPSTYTHSQTLPDISNVDCAVCHSDDDPHNGQFSSDCRSCHATSGWVPSTFDHNQSDFLLTGKHQNLDCTSCHVDGQYIIDTQCISCHQGDDPHSGQFGNSCELCHTPSGWTPPIYTHAQPLPDISGIDCAVCHSNDNPHQGQFDSDCRSCHATSGWVPSTFDHSQSDFPLTGEHQELDCARCHIGGQFNLGTRCISCHGNDDPHGRQFGTSCDLCHTPAGWTPSTYTHDQPLPNISDDDCIICHQGVDPHNGQFGNSCGSCHSTTSWETSGFSHTFPLEDNHDTACASCHTDANNWDQFSCLTSCHAKAETDSEHQGENGYVYKSSRCLSCHPTGKASSGDD